MQIFVCFLLLRISDRAILIQLSGYLNPDIWIQISESGYLNPDIWIRIFESGYLKPDIWNRISETGYLKPDIWNRISASGYLNQDTDIWIRFRISNNRIQWLRSVFVLRIQHFLLKTDYFFLFKILARFFV